MNYVVASLVDLVCLQFVSARPKLATSFDYCALFRLARCDRLKRACDETWLPYRPKRYALKKSTVYRVTVPDFQNGPERSTRTDAGEIGQGKG